mgnify:CR=1 FL=1
MARPIDASAAASVSIMMNMIWPSGCTQRLPATTKAMAAAFIMISMLINMNRILRRTITPAKPKQYCRDNQSVFKGNLVCEEIDHWVVTYSSLPR